LDRANGRRQIRKAAAKTLESLNSPRIWQFIAHESPAYICEKGLPEAQAEKTPKLDASTATSVHSLQSGLEANSAMFNVGNGYQLYLPTFGRYSPRNCGEGKGVVPDVSVDIDPDRLACGDDAQVKKALELLE